MWVAESTDHAEENRIVGWSSFGPCRDEGAPPRAGELYSIFVLRELWGTGLGRELLARSVAGLAVRDLVPISLWVLAGNVRARRFYERHGFGLERGHERGEMSLLSGREKRRTFRSRHKGFRRSVRENPLRSS